jgi:hypothetical protein
MSAFSELAKGPQCCMSVTGRKRNDLNPERLKEIGKDRNRIALQAASQHYSRLGEGGCGEARAITLKPSGEESFGTGLARQYGNRYRRIDDH